MIMNPSMPSLGDGTVVFAGVCSASAMPDAVTDELPARVYQAAASCMFSVPHPGPGGSRTPVSPFPPPLFVFDQAPT